MGKGCRFYFNKLSLKSSLESGPCFWWAFLRHPTTSEYVCPSCSRHTTLTDEWLAPGNEVTGDSLKRKPWQFEQPRSLFSFCSIAASNKKYTRLMYPLRLKGSAFVDRLKILLRQQLCAWALTQYLSRGFRRWLTVHEMAVHPVEPLASYYQICPVWHIIICFWINFVQHFHGHRFNTDNGSPGKIRLSLKCALDGLFQPLIELYIWLSRMNSLLYKAWIKPFFRTQKGSPSRRFFALRHTSQWTRTMLIPSLEDFNGD